jgi:5-formyltetrahydrofolate cyclo-ligase
MIDIAAQKKIQREAGISARRSIPREQAIRYSENISRKLAEHSAYQDAKTIFSYRSFGGEVDVSHFNERARRDGKTVAFPICRNEGRMVAAVPFDDSAWETGRYGIRAPVESHSGILDPLEIDLVIVPCTAFSGSLRMRVGMGAGYYDRYLPQCKNAVSIAIAYEVQRMEDIYGDQWDVPLNAIVTESGYY